MWIIFQPTKITEQNCETQNNPTTTKNDKTHWTSPSHRKRLLRVVRLGGARRSIPRIRQSSVERPKGSESSFDVWEDAGHTTGLDELGHIQWTRRLDWSRVTPVSKTRSIARRRVSHWVKDLSRCTQEQASTVEGNPLPRVLMTSCPRRVGGKHVLWRLVGLIHNVECWTDWTLRSVARCENGCSRWVGTIFVHRRLANHPQTDRAHVVLWFECVSSGEVHCACTRNNINPSKTFSNNFYINLKHLKNFTRQTTVSNIKAIWNKLIETWGTPEHRNPKPKHLEPSINQPKPSENKVKQFENNLNNQNSFQKLTKGETTCNKRNLLELH